MSKIITVYAEKTPNPETLKFVVNKDLGRGGSFDFPDAESAKRSPLATELFENFPFVKGVFISQDFITVTKTEEAMWIEVIPKVRNFLKDYISEDKPIIPDVLMEEAPSFAPEDGDTDVVRKIKEILANNVRPVVEMDGGAIDFVKFDEGIVTLAMRGACSGCPSSAVTLKAGIEGLLKRLIPEVQEVVAESL